MKLRRQARKFTHEDRVFVRDHDLEQLLMIDQLPGKEIIKMLRLF